MFVTNIALIILRYRATASLLVLLPLLRTMAEVEVVMGPGAIACRCFVTLFKRTDAFCIY